MACNEGVQSSERCGFKLGKAENGDCYQMRRIVGYQGEGATYFVKKADLPPVEEWVNRLNNCGERVNPKAKSFCRSATKAWVWEAFACKIYERYNRIDLWEPCMCLQKYCSGDGIMFIEATPMQKDSDFRMKAYEDFKPPDGPNYVNPDSFVNNQWCETIRSVGATGTIFPITTNSYTYRSLIDKDKIGIICPWDEIWLGSFFWCYGTGMRGHSMWWEFFFRPREISRHDLYMMLLKGRCGRPCLPENVFNWPCPVDNPPPEALPRVENVKDDDDVLMPTGETIKGVEYKKQFNTRTGEKDPCVKTCVSEDPPPDPDPNVNGPYMYQYNYVCPDSTRPCHRNTYQNLDRLLQTIPNETLKGFYDVIGNQFPTGRVLHNDKPIAFTIREWMFPDFNDHSNANRITWALTIDPAWYNIERDCYVYFRQTPEYREGYGYIYVDMGVEYGRGDYFIPERYTTSTLVIHTHKIVKYLRDGGYNIDHKHFPDDYVIPNYTVFPFKNSTMAQEKVSTLKNVARAGHHPGGGDEPDTTPPASPVPPSQEGMQVDPNGEIESGSETDGDATPGPSELRGKACGCTKRDKTT